MPHAPPCTALFLFAGGAFGWACSKDTSNTTGVTAPHQGWFREITAVSGLDFVQSSGSTGRRYLPEMSAAGVALFDSENDGDLDLYLLNGALLSPDPVEEQGRQNRFYRQTSPLSFEDHTAASGLGDRGYGMGAAIGDIDNDGDRDLLVTNFGPDRLYANDGTGSFSERSAGITTRGFSSSAAFFDYDRDGFLDLYVGVYVEFDPEKPCFDSAGNSEYCGPSAFPPLADVLFHNRDGIFEDVSVEAGLHAATGAALGVVCADLDEDGWQDVYVANDGYVNRLWNNQHDGTFVDEALFQGVALNMNGQPEAGMGVIAADFDGDLRLDLFVTHLREETNTLYLNQGAGVGFVDSTGKFGVGAASIPFTGFGTVAVDFDHDLDLDIAVANGSVLRGKRRNNVELADPWALYAEPNLLFINEGQGRFYEASELASEFCELPEISRGLAAGDLDGDGDMDLLLGNIEGPARLFENVIATKDPKHPRGHWLQVRCLHPEWKRDAIGARVIVRCGDVRTLRTIGGGSSFLSSQPSVAHFGLGRAERVDEIIVHWPDGLVERFAGMDADRRVELVCGTGESE